MTDFDWDAAIAGMRAKPKRKLTLSGPECDVEPDILRNQFYCINGNSGYEWMLRYMPSYDALPRSVRERLQHSPFNICTVCLTAVLPQTSARLRSEGLLMCVEIREHQIRSGRP
jgi:hypothetical protein